MKIDKVRTIAFVSIALTPFVLMGLVFYRWRIGSCVGTVHDSIWLLMIFAALIATTKNPYRAIAACLMYIPIGYIFTTYPCTHSRNASLIFVIWPIFPIFILLATFIGGWLLRLIFGLTSHSAAKSDGASR